jgi:LPXTG-site transpeptidase (sortase) family protein
VRILRIMVAAAITLTLGHRTQYVVLAAPDLSIEPITWNVIGLDSNDVMSGPNTFPVGARVCNTGPDAATNLTATFNFTDGEDRYLGNDYINLRDGSEYQITLDTLGAGTEEDPTCADFYFEAEVTRRDDAYGKKRSYEIVVTADGDISLYTPTPRELYIEHLISQNRNSTTNVELDGDSIPSGGTMSLTVGNTYEIKLYGSTATNGYEQLQSFLHLPNTIFQVLSVSTLYDADTSPYVENPNDKLYADSCLWENDPNSLNYRSCLDVGKNGGDVIIAYQVKIIGGAGTSETLNSLIYDFSGSSYHYNSDFTSTARIIEIVGPSSITIQKQFVPDSILPGGTSTLKITITNPTSSTIEGVNFSDTFPTEPYQMVVAADPAASTTGCGSPTFSPLADDISIDFIDGTLAPSSSCIVKVDVTVPTAESYVNTTGFLFINTTINTGNTATDTLTAAEAAVCTPGVRMAYWPIPDGTTDNPPDLPGGAPTEKSDRVSTASVAANDPLSTLIDDSGGSNDDTKWVTWGYKTPIQWIDFVIDTSNFSDVVMTFHEMVDANGPLTLVVSCDTGPACSSVLTIDPHPRDSVFRLRTADFTGLTDPGGITTFRISGTGANNDQSGANLHLDEIEFIGCMETDPPPTLDKSFAPDTIPQNDVSTLTFSLSNTNPSAVDLTGVAFSDVLPPGLEVADIPNASTTCLGPVVWNPLDGDTTLNFSGATMAASSSCTAQVDIKATSAGVFDNVSNNISSNESGENTSPDGYGTDTLTAIAPPSIGKVFADSLILTDATTTLTFTITNPNQSAALTGIGFTDTLPDGLTVESSSDPQCGGTLTTTNPSTIELTGGSLAADSSCAFAVTVTGESTGVKINTTESVNSNEGGEGNTASDTLTVRDPIASISLIKLVATSDTGPWQTYLAVPIGAEVHYRFVVENTGEVPLSPVSITDDTIDVTACNAAWSSITLPVAVAANDDHITTCTLGPFDAAEGSHKNAALATGTYDSTDITSYPPSEATYATTGLTLVKSVAQIRFSGTGETLNYTYLVTNSGYAQLEGPVTIDDDKATDESCPEITTVGDGDAYLEPGESITCTASYLTQGADVDAGLVTNTATATIDGVPSPEDSETVPYEAPVDLGVTKDDGVTMYLPGGSLTYTITVSNAGPNDAIDATFVDNRPADINSWSWSCVATGTASCGAADSGTGDISVSDIDLPSGAGNFLTYTIDATVSGSATDPITNIASVTAPDSTYDTNTGDNAASDTDTLTPPVDLGVTKTDGVTEYYQGGSLTYTILVSNAGPNDAVDATFVDNRPADISLWSWSCVATGTASCGATDSGTGDISVSDIDLPSGAGNFLTYTIDATVSGSATDPITNIASVTAPDGTYDTDTGDNAASDTDTMKPEPSMALTKTGTLDNTVVGPGTESNVGDTITYAFQVENTGNIPLNNIVVTDPMLPTLDCSIPSLAVGAQTSCLASNNVYLLTQADIDAGVVNNTASADSEETDPTTDSESVPLTQVPVLSIEKEVGEDGNTWVEKIWVEIGDTVYFRVRIANDGNVTLTGLAVEDGMASCTLVRDADLSGDNDDDFEIGEEWQYTCSISAVQGSYTNTATANSNETEEVTDDATYVGGSIFDPPSGIKTVNQEGASVLEWTMVWINDSNDTVLDARVSDPIPEFSTYVESGAPSGYPVPGGAPAGSTNVGVSCTDTSASTTTTACYYEGITGLYPRGRIVWEGSIGPDLGAANAGEAEHELTITFSILLDDGITTIENVATLDADLNGDGDYGDTGESEAATVDRAWERELPPTGFAPGRVTAPHEGAQPFALRGGLELEVPVLGIQVPIVGVPADGGSWGVNWLNDQAGWLQGTAFPSWPGNSVLTGHSYLASGLPGPFVDLKELSWGDEIILHVFGYRHVYRVQRRLFVLPDDISVIAHKDDPWLTLITCYGFDEARDAYRYRIVVQAVWVRAEIEY